MIQVRNSVALHCGNGAARRGKYSPDDFPRPRGTLKMPSLIGCYAQRRRLLCLAAKRRQTIPYGARSTALGLKSPRQEWNTVLGPIAANEVKATGHDLTLVVVYASGPAKGLGRWFSNIRGGAPPQSNTLNPRNPQQVASYKQALQQMFNKYATVQC